MKNHQEVYDDFIQKEDEKNRLPNSSKSQMTLDSMCNLGSKIKVKITKKQLINACVELVTVNGRPYSILNDSGFKKILDPMICGLQKTIVLNSTSIR